MFAVFHGKVSFWRRSLASKTARAANKTQPESACLPGGEVLLAAFKYITCRHFGKLTHDRPLRRYRQSVSHSQSPFIHNEFASATGQDISYDKLFAELGQFNGVVSNSSPPAARV